MTAGRLLSLAGAASAALLLCAFIAPTRATETALSPDGKLRAGIDHPAGDDADANDPAASVLWVEPAHGGPRRVLLSHGREGQDVKRSLKSFQTPTWSLDGGYVYVNADAWATSSAVHQINAKTGAEHFIIDGGVQGVIRTGPYRGMLLVQRHKYHPAPQLGSYDPVDVVQPHGKVMLTVPGSDTDEGEPSVANWLKAHGWSAN